jgi:hypothetical protein
MSVPEEWWLLMVRFMMVIRYRFAASLSSHYESEIGPSIMGFDIRARPWHEAAHHPILNSERNRRG